MAGSRSKSSKITVNEETAVAQVERLIADMLDDGAATPAFFPQSMRAFRKALTAVGRQDKWELLDIAFTKTLVVGVEVLVRGLLALRGEMDCHDQFNRKGGLSFPNIQEHAERTERTIRFLLEAARDFSRVRHLTQLARREDDPKIIDFEKARKAAKGRKRADKGCSRRRAAGKNA